jgi:hypothetical protein
MKMDVKAENMESLAVRPLVIKTLTRAKQPLMIMSMFMIMKMIMKMEMRIRASGTSVFPSDDWERFLARWKSLDGSAVKVVIPTWLVMPAMVMQNFIMRHTEYGIDGILAAADLLKDSPYWQNRKITIEKFLYDETIPKLQGSGYDWNPDAPKKPKPDKSKDTAPLAALERYND